jgi:hypothetical protein
MIDLLIAFLGEGYHLLSHLYRRSVPWHTTAVSMGKCGGAFLSIRR